MAQIPMERKSFRHKASERDPAGGRMFDKPAAATSGRT